MTRLFLLSLTITLLNIFTPVLAASGDVFLVYRPDDQGRIATVSGEKWMDNAPEAGKNVPAGSMVLKFIPESNDNDPWHYTRQNNRLVYTPPAEPTPPPATPVDENKTAKDAASDISISNETFIKILRKEIGAGTKVNVNLGL